MDRAVFERMELIDGAHWWFSGRRAIVKKLLLRFAPARRLRILEIGCGTGSNLRMLQALGSVDAIEPDEAARAHATSRSGIEVADGTMPDGVRIADAAYDVIVLLDVLEHIADDTGTLALLSRKLAPGGRLLLTVPSAPWMWSAHDVAHHHHRRYAWPDLERRVELAGFRICHHAHFNTILYPLIAAARLLGRIAGKADGDDALPSPLMNEVLKAIFTFERRWVSRVAVPFGVSLAVVAEVI